jgi:proline racemase
VAHPTKPHINTVDLVEIYEDLEGEEADCRNVVIFGEAQADRSPCGRGTSAKMAALYTKGHLKLHRPFVNESIIGTRFTGHLHREEPVDNMTAVVPEISGNAYVTGFQQSVVDARDPLKFGSTSPVEHSEHNRTKARSSRVGQATSLPHVSTKAEHWRFSGRCDSPSQRPRAPRL